MKVIKLVNEAAMVGFGQSLAAACETGAVVFLNGTLGMGKTTLCRGVLMALGHDGAVKSPTYTLVEPYELQGRTVYHFDLYRLGDPEELEYMGIREYFDKENICLIEWPECGKGVLPEPDITIDIQTEEMDGEMGRALAVTAITDRGEQILTAI